jgi:hypothetical protein
VGQADSADFNWTSTPTKIKTSIIVEYPAKNSVRPSEGAAEGGFNGEIPSCYCKKTEASSVVLLVQSKTPQKSFLFLLEEKSGRAQNHNRKESFSTRQIAATRRLAANQQFLLK